MHAKLNVYMDRKEFTGKIGGFLDLGLVISGRLAEDDGCVGAGSV